MKIRDENGQQIEVIKSGLSTDDLIDVLAELVKKGIDAGLDLKAAFDQAMEKLKGAPLFKTMVENGEVNADELEKAAKKEFAISKESSKIKENKKRSYGMMRKRIKISVIIILIIILAGTIFYFNHCWQSSFRYRIGEDVELRIPDENDSFEEVIITQEYCLRHHQYYKVRNRNDKIISVAQEEIVRIDH